MNTELIQKIRKPVLIVTGVIATYALVGFVALPKLIEAKLPDIIESETGRKAALERMEFNPFSLELSLQGFSMQEKDEDTFVSFDEFFINVQVWDSIREFALVLADIRLSGPYVRLEELKGGQYNFSDLLTESAEEEAVVEDEESGIFPVIINQLTIAEGRFKRVDSTYSEPVVSLMEGIDLHLEHFSTLPDKGTKMGFSLALSSGGHFRWQGDFGVNPVFSTGEIELEGLKFAKVWTLFLQDIVNFKWVDGTQLIKFNYALSYAEEKFSFELTEGRWLTENLKFNQLKGEQTLIDIPYFAIEGIQFNLNQQSVDIAKVESRGMGFEAWLNSAGELNYQTLFAMQESKGEPEPGSENTEATTPDEVSKPWDINIQEVALNTAKFNFSDRSQKEPVLVKVGALDLGAKNYRLSAGELIDMTIPELSVNSSKISVIDKGHQKPVLMNIDALGLGVKSFHLTAGKSLQMLANQGYLNLQAFSLKTDKEKPLVQVPSVKMAGLDFNFQDKKIKIASISSRDAVIKAWLEKNGEINYQNLFAPIKQEQKVSQEQVAAVEQTDDKEGRSWALELEEFKIDNYALQFKDYTPSSPVALNLAALDFSMTQFNNQQGTRLPVSLSTQFNKHGNIKISGSTILEPFSSDLKLSISKIALHTFEPYINQSARLNIIKGGFNAQGQLSVSLPNDGDLDLRYKGGVDIKNLHTRDKVLNQDFLKWKQLKLNGLDFNLQPAKLKIKSIDLKSPYARVTIKKDKTTNINDVIIEQKIDTKVKPKTNKQKETPFVYNIAAINITDGESDFSDFSLILPFVVALNDLQGDIDNISSNQRTKTKVGVTGKVFDLSPIDIKGSFTADLDDLDIGMHFKSLPLPFISPYMVEFSGNKIGKGKMSLDLVYQVKNKRLSAKNSLLIDQLELGEKVENPDAVDLPLGLAIALLKDKDGKIIIDMPLEGSMDDPEFSVGPLVFDTFVNLLMKVIASPFSAIGSFLGSDEDFSVVSFAPGSAEITAEQGNKIAELAKALLEKPELSLEVEGGAYTNQDWPAMKEQALIDQLKQMRSDELKKEGEIKLAEYIELSEDDYERLLADLFIQTFPELAKRSIFGTPKLTHPDMGEFDVVAKNMLQGMIKPNNHKLHILSLTRARNIARLLVKEGKVEQPRIFILDGKVVSDAEENILNANLTLKVQ